MEGLSVNLTAQGSEDNIKSLIGIIVLELSKDEMGKWWWRCKVSLGIKE